MFEELPRLARDVFAACQEAPLRDGGSKASHVPGAVRILAAMLFVLDHLRAYAEWYDGAIAAGDDEIAAAADPTGFFCIPEDRRVDTEAAEGPRVYGMFFVGSCAEDAAVDVLSAQLEGRRGDHWDLLRRDLEKAKADADARSYCCVYAGKTNRDPLVRVGEHLAGIGGAPVAAFFVAPASHRATVHA